MKHSIQKSKAMLLSLLLIIGGNYCSAQNIEGTYNLYRSTDPSGAVIATMTISGQQDKTFVITGKGWQGTGSITQGIGYYNWTFTNGTSGSTTISLNPDGSITGQVMGPADKEGLNWRYIAKAISRPQKNCGVTVDDIITRGDRHDYFHFKNNCGFDRTANVCVTTFDDTGKPIKNLKSVVVPANNYADLEYKLTDRKGSYSFTVDTAVPCQ